MSKRGLNSLIALGILSIMLIPIFVCNNFKKDEAITEEKAVLKFTSVKADNQTTVENEPIIHTHIWATVYNNDKHWEYCTVCEEVRNTEEHTMVDNWFFGYPSCHTGSGNNYCTRICECGYNYIYRKPHGEVKGWYNTGVRQVHFKYCADCGSWTDSGKCRNEKGYLGCYNPGKCIVCGVESTSDWHYITCSDDKKGGKCRDCGKDFFKIENYSLSYTEDYSAAIIQFTYVPLDDSVEFTGYMGAYCGDSNYTGVKWTYEIAEDGSCTYTGVYTFDINKQRKSHLYFNDKIGILKINGLKVYNDASIIYEEIWQDHEAPKLTAVEQRDQATSGDWATIKELTIKGEENLAKIVTLTIKDKLTDDVIISGAKTTVVDGKFVYKCTPEIEGPVEGRDYVLIMTDETGNERKEVFTIYRTDSRAPLLVESDFSEWSSSKMVAIPLTDYGSGLVQTSLDSQYCYQPAVYKDGKYYGCYPYLEENYGVDRHILFMKDGLGNARREVINIGHIDNTKPTIVDILSEKKGSYVDIQLVTDDYSRKMKAQGSGAASYAITTNCKIPTDWQDTNKLKVNKAGEYFVWVKDKAGNIGDFRIIEVDEELNITKDAKPPVIDDSPVGVENVARYREDEFIYAYFAHNSKTRGLEYIREDDDYIHLFGINNNEESMYVYLSSSKRQYLVAVN